MIGTITFIIATFLVSFVCGIITIPQITSFCKKKELYDMPNLRKVHTTNIPRMGGTCFMPCMIVAALLSVAVYRFKNDETLTISLWSFMFLVSIILVYTIGLIDDIVGVSPRIKFVVQILAASLMPFSGLYINNLYGFMGIEAIPFYVGAPLTVFVIVFIDNAINLIDGIDGLAGGLAVLALVGFLYCFQREGMFVYSVLIAGLIGVVVSFLYYNIYGGKNHKYKIFMGDSGSLTLGFMLAFLLVKFVMNNPNVMPFRSDSLLLSYTLLIVPCFDVVRVIISRLCDGQPIFKADKRHLHHKLLRSGLSQHCALITILGLQIVFVVLNVVLYRFIPITYIVVVDVLAFVLFNIVINSFIKRAEAVRG